MPFWTTDAAKGTSHKGPYPTYRCNDGKAYGESGCDLRSGEYKIVSDSNAAVRRSARKDGPYEWLTGPRNELLERTYVRMHARQTYAYGVAYHLTGKPEYLALAHRGVQWLLANAIDKTNGSYTFISRGKPGPAPEYRTSQDQSYTLLGLAFYYYLTRDEAVLSALSSLKEKVKEHYMAKDWEGGRLIRWMRKTKQEPNPTCLSTIPAPDKGTVDQKELVAILDQVNAYMLLTTVSAPQDQRKPWLNDLHSMAQTIRDRFYNGGNRSKPQRETGLDPTVPEEMFAGCLTYAGPPKPPPGTQFCENGKNLPLRDPENCDPANHHTDFGHSIKSFWMLYLIGREYGDEDMVKFAVDHSIDLFAAAYLDNGTWGRAKSPAPNFDPQKPTFVVDRNKEWWIYAELDQMAGTMALHDPARYVPRLNTTYAYWRQVFLSQNSEVAQWKYDACEGTDDQCPNRRIPKANLWKNAFHSTEHALVAYITTSGVEKTPAVLYFALVPPGDPQLRPYYYQAEVATTAVGRVEDGGVSYRVVRAQFTNIR